MIQRAMSNVEKGSRFVKKTERPNVKQINQPRHDFSNVGATVVHRIIAGSLTSRWFTYEQIVTLKTPTAVYRAATDHYHGSLPTNCVFVISEIK